MFLKQSSTYTFRFGPFIDDGDGKTVEDGYTLGRAEIRLSKDGGNFAQKTESSDSTHDEIGYYIVNLDATDTNTCGELLVACHKSGALPVFKHFYVVEENIYAALFDASAAAFDANQRVDVAKVEGSDATDQINAACDAALSDYDAPTKTEMDSAFSTTNGKIDTVDTVVDRIEVDTQDIQSRIPASLVSGKIDASVSDVTSAGLNDIWTTDIVEAYAGASETACTPAELFYMILSCVGSFKIESDKIITLKLNETDQAMRFDMDSATDPTYRKRDA